LQLLSDVLGAELLLHGSVRALTLDAAAGSASVTLAFEVVDGRSGELRTSGEARGAQSATATVTANQQEVIVRALAAAAENLAETLTGARVAATPPPAAPGTAGNAAAPPVAASALPAALVPAAGATADEPRLSPPRTELTVAAAPKTAAGSAAPAPNVRIEIIAKPTAPGTAAPPVIPPAPSEAAGDLALPVEAKVLAKLAPDRVLITLGRTMIVTPKMELDVYRVTYPRGEG
jgi:hypothetical protein